MDDLTDLWLVDTVNLNASDLDALLNNLTTIQGTTTEGILHMTQANYDVFGPLLAAWDDEEGHHVQFVVPGDFDFDGDVDGNDFLYWQLNDGSQSDLDEWQAEFSVPVSGDFDDDGDVDGTDFLHWQLNDGSASGLADWQANFGNVASPITAASTTVPEPATGLMLMLGMAALAILPVIERKHS